MLYWLKLKLKTLPVHRFPFWQNIGGSSTWSTDTCSRTSEQTREDFKGRWIYCVFANIKIEFFLFFFRQCHCIVFYFFISFIQYWDEHCFSRMCEMDWLIEWLSNKQSRVQTWISSWELGQPCQLIETSPSGSGTRTRTKEPGLGGIISNEPRGYS